MPIIDHGKFTFTGTAPYPLGVKLLSKSGPGYLTSLFYIEAGTQTILCDKDSLREIPKITNNSMKELKGSYHDAFINYNSDYYSIEAKYDSLHKVYNGHLPKELLIQRDDENRQLGSEYNRTLIAYTQNHPDSYVALWKIAERLAFSYVPAIDTIYAQFSGVIKQTFTGKALKKSLDEEKSTNIGVAFPRLTVADTNRLTKILAVTNGKHKYTLVDFWFSHCPPCLGQFPKYKKIYDSYKNNGLEIIGISVDRTEALNDWKKVIREKELPWPQYLDENGTIATSMVITSFPRNFLLDEHGIIIRKDITPEQLEQILAK